MIIVDNALQARAAEGRPVRVALIGAGYMARGLANHLANTTTGLRFVGVSNRRPERAFELCSYAGLGDVIAAGTQLETDRAIRAGKTVVAEDALLLAASTEVDVLVEITGSVEFGATLPSRPFGTRKTSCG